MMSRICKLLAWVTLLLLSVALYRGVVVLAGDLMERLKQPRSQISATDTRCAVHGGFHGPVRGAV